VLEEHQWRSGIHYDINWRAQGESVIPASSLTAVISQDAQRLQQEGG